MFTRSSLRTILALAAFALAFNFLLSSPAVAQKRFVVVNGEEEPVPTYQAARYPYQFAYGVQKRQLTEDCDLIPVPDGMTLTITSVGVEATISRGELPSVSLRIIRSGGGGGVSAYRFMEALYPVSSNDMYRRYKGIYRPDMVVGSAEGGSRFSAAMCVRGSEAGSEIANSARGIVRGYLEPTVIVDGNVLARQMAEEEVEPEPPVLTLPSASLSLGQLP